MAQEIITLDLGGVNAYLVKENGGFLLVDTGGPMMLDKEYTDRREVLIQKLEEHGCKKGSLNMVVLTHGDCDHCANAAYLAKEYGAKIVMHQKDVCQVTNLTSEIYLKSCQFHSLGLKVMSVVLHKLIKKVADATAKRFETFTPDLYLVDKESLSKYGFDLEVITLPGHTLGSIGLYTANQDLIAGDIYQGSKKPKPSDNAWDYAQLKESLNKLKKYEIHTIYPGHGSEFSMEQIRSR